MTFSVFESYNTHEALSLGSTSLGLSKEVCFGGAKGCYLSCVEVTCGMYNWCNNCLNGPKRVNTISILLTI